MGLRVPHITSYLTEHFDDDGFCTLEGYEARGGYQGLRKALDMSPADVVELMKASGLQGRGGAGFSCGMKWSFMPSGDDKPKYLVCNADESEPGSFKDRILLERGSHQMLEGIIIAAWATGAAKTFVYVRGEYAEPAAILERAVKEVYDKGYLGEKILGKKFRHDVVVHRGAGAYICGEETGLLESLEGKKGQPRKKPPFPAQYGAFGMPTTVNNVETFSHVPHILSRGVDWFRGFGTEKSPGTTVFGVSGHVQRPGLYELPLGTPLDEIVYEHAGGPPDGRKVKGVIPGGMSMPILPADLLDVPMANEFLRERKTMLGTGGVMVMDDTTCMVRASCVISYFFRDESCGQCTQCREGTGWINKVVERIERGAGVPDDLEILADIAAKMEGQTICAFADAAAWPIQGMLRHFRSDFEEHIRQHKCPFHEAFELLMPRVTVDGQILEVPEGRTILQALDDSGLLMNGVDIPHYCWHPKLPIDGSCRLCQVEVEGMPKLQIACNTPVQDGMAIRTDTERVRQAREGVMELLLVNHPLDCPICDQAGECKLQDYAFEYGVDSSRTREPRRALKKNVDLGPTIVFDQERCILCRRCVRFCDEVPGTSELRVMGRGDRSVIETLPGTPLDNDYSMNVADICPVGALTTKDFRFKIRVWFLEEVPGVCTGCSRGCNVHVGVANNKAYRYVPRRNDAVNDTWICDEGRFSYKEIGSGSRLREASVRNDDGRPEAVGAPASVFAAVEGLRRVVERRGADAIVFLASPHATNEDLFTARRFVDALSPGAAGACVVQGRSDDLLIRAEKAANAEGARVLGFGDPSQVLERIRDGRAAAAIVMGHDVLDEAFLGGTDALSGLEMLVVIDSQQSPLAQIAHSVLPVRHAAEKHGSLTNCAGRVQRLQPALEPAWEAASEGEWLARIGAGLGLDGFDGAWEVNEVSKALSESVADFAGVHLESLGDGGRPLAGREAPEDGA